MIGDVRRHRGRGRRSGALTPFALSSLLAVPRAVRAVKVMRPGRRRSPPAGYVGWPLWYHRVCLVHNRAFGWLYVAGLGLGALYPEFRL